MEERFVVNAIGEHLGNKILFDKYNLKDYAILNLVISFR